MKFTFIALLASVVVASKDDLEARKQLLLSQLEEIDNQINLEDAAGTETGAEATTDTVAPTEDPAAPAEEPSNPWLLKAGLGVVGAAVVAGAVIYKKKQDSAEASEGGSAEDAYARFVEKELA